MNVRNLFNWFREYIYHYNLFIPEENDYNDDENNTTTTILRHQIYATRLYVPLLIITVYILTFIVVIIPPRQEISVSNTTESLFDQLYHEHSETLSCSCSSINIPYKSFVTNTISFHPICSSIFVSQEWIEALYSPYASAFLVMDFRKMASSQFEFLAAFCLISRERVSQLLADMDNEQLVSSEFLRKTEVQSRIMVDIDIIKANAATEDTITLRLLQIATQQNSLISALQTNIFVAVYTELGRFNSVYPSYTFYKDDNLNAIDQSLILNCYAKASITPAGFYLYTPFDSAINHMNWPFDPPNFEPIASAIVDGFFGRCNI
ncbi:hypothetical protein I4U23_027427 [Adineta vaga]|nr:hypothetical protein I4U23_027427 [Adineta vaga]